MSYPVYKCSLDEKQDKPITVKEMKPGTYGIADDGCVYLKVENSAVCVNKPGNSYMVASNQVFVRQLKKTKFTITIE